MIVGWLVQRLQGRTQRTQLEIYWDLAWTLCLIRSARTNPPWVRWNATRSVSLPISSHILHSSTLFLRAHPRKYLLPAQAEWTLILQTLIHRALLPWSKTQRYESCRRRKTNKLCDVLDSCNEKPKAMLHLLGTFGSLSEMRSWR